MCEFVFWLSEQVGIILSYSIQETLRLALTLGALVFVHVSSNVTNPHHLGQI